MASVAYAIEGPKETLEKIQQAIIKAMETNKDFWTEAKTCEILEMSATERNNNRLGGELSEEPYFDESSGALRFSAEERWGLQDFVNCLEIRFPDIKAYWSVVEPDCEVYCTNDKEGKYFPQRFFVDTAQDDVYQSEYFQTEEAMYEWLNEKYGVKTKEEVDAWNQDYEATGDDCENFIYIHEFEIVD